MKKQTRYCLIMLAVLVLAAAVYGGLRWWNAGEENRTAAETVYAVQLDGVTQLSITDSDGDTLSFVQNGGTWYWADNEEFPLEQSALTDITDILSALPAEKVIDTPDDLADYGMDEPGFVVSGVYGSGESFKLTIGDYNSSYTYYAVLDGDARVYTITSSLKSAVDFDLLEAAVPEELPSMSSTDISRVILQDDAGARYLVKKTATEQVEVEKDTGEVDEDGNAVMETVTEEQTSDTWYLDGEAVSGDGLTAYLSSLGSLSFSDCADFQPEDLSVYGLDEASRTVLTVELEEGDRVVLWFGTAEGEDGTAACYAKTGDGVLVYSLSDDSGLTSFDSILGENGGAAGTEA